MNIGEPILISKKVEATYSIDVNGTNINVYYWYDLDDEGKGGWDWDLSPCYQGLTEEEIEDLDDAFEVAIQDLGA